MELNFRPLKPWPNLLPPVEWQGLRLAGFGSPLKPNEMNDLNPENTVSFAHTLKACYPHLSLAELSRLYHLRPTQKNNVIVWTEVFSVYGLRWDENLKSVVEKIGQTPEDFQNWTAQKGLGSKDLRILTSVEIDNKVKNWLKLFAKNPLSKSQATQALEWTLECYLKDSKVLDELTTEPMDQKWLKKVKALRFPLTEETDQQKRLKLLGLPWPKGTHVQFVRRGDQSGVELKIFLSRPYDLEKTLQTLKTVKDKWSQDAE